MPLDQSDSRFHIDAPRKPQAGGSASGSLSLAIDGRILDAEHIRMNSSTWRLKKSCSF
jgi:hypothetical protein